MARSYNAKGLVKLIKKAAKDRLYWHRTEDAEYVTNAHWAVMAPQFEPEVKAALYGAIGRECTVGQSIGVAFKTFVENGPDITRIYAPEKAQESGILTPLIHLALGDIKTEVRIIKLGDKLTAINNEYAALIDESVTECRGTHNAPIYFGQDGDVLILPIRFESDLTETIAQYFPKERRPHDA